MFLQVGSFLAPYYDVYEKNTKKIIPLVQWVDTRLQILEKYIFSSNGDLKTHWDSINQEWILDKEIIVGGFVVIGKNFFFRFLQKYILK